MDLVLRDNQTSSRASRWYLSSPQGCPAYQEGNIGLIEVMGLAILPPRLKEEVEQVAAYLVGEGVSVAAYHQEWADELKESHPGLSDKEEALDIVKESVGKIFTRVLEDAGVYKQTAEGQVAFMRFVAAVGIIQ